MSIIPNPSSDNITSDEILQIKPHKGKDFIFYALGSLGLSPFSFFLYSFLLIYGVSMLGLPALFVGTVYSLSQIFYAIILPFFGNLSDHIRNHRTGSRVPLIIIGIPGLVLVYYFFWIIPPNTQFGLIQPKSAYLFISLIFLYRLFFACIWASYQAMIPDIAKSEKTQMKIMGYLNLFSYIGQIIGTFLPVIILTEYPFPEGENIDYYWLLNINGIGYQIQKHILLSLIALFILCIVCLIVVLYFVHIPKNAVVSSLSTQSLKKTWYASVQQIIQNKPVLYTTISTVFITVATSSMNYISINFAVYTLQLGIYFPFFFSFVIIASLASFFLSGILAQKFGLKRMLLLSALFFSFCFLIMAALFLYPFGLFVQIGTCILIILNSFYVGCFTVYSSTIITKFSALSETNQNQSHSGNYITVFQAFGMIGNMIAIVSVSAVLDSLGSVAFLTYVWIFLGCGVISLGAIFFIRKIRI